jgi:polyhydroxyalkanoate synthesis regulator phasin
MAKEQRPLQRYVDLGMAFTEEARRRAEEILREVAREGNAGRAHAEEFVGDLVEKSRKASEQFVDLIRDEVKRQVQALDLASKEDVVNLVQRVADTLGEARERIVEVLDEAGGKVAGGARRARPGGHKEKDKGKEKDHGKAARHEPVSEKAEKAEKAEEHEATPAAATPGASFAKKAAARKAAAQSTPASTTKKAAATKKAATTSEAPAAAPAAPAAPAAKRATTAKKAAGQHEPTGEGATE